MLRHHGYSIFLATALVLAFFCSVLRAEFETVINIPPEFVDYRVNSNTQINLYDGGSILENFSAGRDYTSSRNIEVNVYGGFVRYNFVAGRGSTVNIFDGELDTAVQARPSSQINIFGGILNHGFEARSGSKVNVLGGKFLLNGLPIVGLNQIGDEVTLEWTPGSLLTGVLANGTPFVFAEYLDKFSTNTLSLKLSELPEVGPAQLESFVDALPDGIRHGQTLVINSPVERVQAGPGSTINHTTGGSSHFEAIGATVNFFDGEARGDLFATSVANVFGGQYSANVYDSSIVNLHEGTFNGTVHGGTMNVFGGIVLSGFRAAGGEVNIHDGSFGSIMMSNNTVVNFHNGFMYDGIYGYGGTANFTGGEAGNISLSSEATVNISGGTIREILRVTNGAQVTFLGDQFLLDGQVLPLSNIGDSIEIEVPDGSVLSGLLADGRLFEFSSDDLTRFWPYTSTSFAGGRVTLQKAALPADSREHIIASEGPLPLAVRQGQILTVDSGAQVGDRFGAGWGSVVNVEQGGKVGHAFQAAGAQVNLRGGTIGEGFDVSNGSVVEMTGGEIHSFMTVFGGGVVNLRSGVIGDDVFIVGTGILNVHGGRVGKNLQAHDGSVINILGGAVGKNFLVNQGGTANVSNGVLEGPISIYGTANLSGGTFIGEVVALEQGTVNVTANALIDRLTSTSDSRVNISGGVVAGRVDVRERGNVHISGGRVDAPMTIHRLGNAEQSGGVIGSPLKVDHRAKMLIRGNEFFLNGSPIANGANLEEVIQVNVPSIFTLHGVLADGTPFAFSSDDSDYFTPGTLSLEWDEVPVATSMHFIVPNDPVPLSIRGEQHLTVNQRGEVPKNFRMGLGSSLDINAGGKVGDNLKVIGGIVNVRGGTLGSNLDLYQGSVVNIESGFVKGGITAYEESTVNFIGGNAGEQIQPFGSFIRAKSGSDVNILAGEPGSVRGEGGSKINVSGGRLGHYSQSLANVEFTLSGGTIGQGFALGDGSTLAIKGNNFLVNGEPISGLENVGDSVEVFYDSLATYTGILEDGTPFAFSHQDGDYISSNVVVTFEHVPVSASEPKTIRASTDVVPYGIREDQHLIVDAGGVVGHSFNAGPGSTVEIEEGGRVDDNFEVIDGIVHLNGGVIGSNATAFAGAVLNINAGQVGRAFRAYPGSTVNVAGGTLDSNFGAFEESTINISGGIVHEYAAYGGATNISGGQFESDFKAFNGSETYLMGTAFELAGVPFQGLQIGVPYRVDSRGEYLTGTLAQGTSFEFLLSDFYSFYGGDFFEKDAAIYLMLVHNPGDYNGDKFVDDADLLVWKEAMLTGDLVADGNYDRIIDEADRDIWQQKLGTSYLPVPEPQTCRLAFGIAMLAIGLIRLPMQLR